MTLGYLEVLIALGLRARTPHALRLPSISMYVSTVRMNVVRIYPSTVAIMLSYDDYMQL